ncbi:MAG: hypothetical protein ACRDZR_12885, partial [Acidimicrobiales bacterium]
MAQRRRPAPSGAAGRARRRPASTVVRAVRTAACGSLAVAAVVLLSAGTGAAPAGAEPISDCSTTAGVIVVVDFAHWGGTVERGCAATPTSGLGALHTAGFGTAGTTEYGAAFVCRIDTDPTATQTPCTTTPPSTAYWSYWHADPGHATWSQSSLGAETTRPTPGSVTAWVFGGTSTTGGSGTGRPTFSPTQVRATNITPVGEPAGARATTTTAPASGTSSQGPAPAVGGSGVTSPPPSTTATTTTTGGTQGSGTTTPPAAGSGTTTTTTTTGNSTTTTTIAGAGGRKARAGRRPRIVDVDPLRARRSPSAGSPLALAVGT